MPHPYHDTFITIHSTVLDSTSSSITLYRATSPIPLMEYTLPFGILNITWFYQRPLPLSSDFSLVALTHKYGVVVLGDNVILADDSGASAKALSKRPAVARRSLFEEMFGVPAITAVSTSSEQSREPATDLGSGGDVAIPWRSSDTTSFFDAPSHLMPPIETFFEPLIDSFLRLRATDDETAAAQVEDGAANAEEDMQVDDVQEIDLVNSSTVSDEAVLDVFVPLFRGMAGTSIWWHVFRKLHLSLVLQLLQIMPTNPTKPSPLQKQSMGHLKGPPSPFRVPLQKTMSILASNLSRQIKSHLWYPPKPVENAVGRPLVDNVFSHRHVKNWAERRYCRARSHIYTTASSLAPCRNAALRSYILPRM